MYSADDYGCWSFIQLIYRWIMYDILDEPQNDIEMQIIIRPPPTTPPQTPPRLSISLSPPPSPPTIRQRITIQHIIEDEPEPCDFEIIEISDTYETKKE